MCIMEIHAGAHTVTMVQAMAHNAATWDGDANMLAEVLKARGEYETLRTLQHAQDYVHHAYTDLLSLYGEEVAALASGADGHVHAAPGEERTFEEVVDASTRAARKDETR
jgi:hypothetical protein